MSHSKSIARNAATVGGATLLSRIAGFVRDMVVAFALGAGPISDAFFVAFRVPNLLRRLFGEGALTMAFIPIFARARQEQGQERAFEMARSAFVWQALILAVLTGLAVALARPLTLLIAPGFSDDPAQFELTVRLVRICFPYVLFISAVALAMGVLNSMGHFLSPALSPVLLNLVLITAALTGYYTGGQVAIWLAWGVFAAGVVQLLFQIPFLRSRGFRIIGPMRLRDAYVSRVGRLMLPTVFGAAVYQVNIILSTMLASFLPSGSVTYLYYADRLVEFPLGVFGFALSTAAMPSLSALMAKGETDEYRRTVDMTLALTLFISIPSAVGLVALSEPVIDLLFGRGAFTPADVSATSMALVAFCLGLPATSIARPLVSAFYAMEDTRTPVIIAALCVAVNIGVGFSLMRPLGHLGLALGVSSASWANALLLSWAFRRRMGRAPKVFRRMAAFGAVAGIMGAAAWWTAAWGKWSLSLIPLWALVYIGLSYVAGFPEAKLLGGALTGRLLRKRR
ncbi:murein biosynthesis integral membrane protein MurJ [Desulfocurvibacter africanus]|uniref:Probable lipid II flippase MurJ n=2 Tax=Desulfocurvibacter africanus TaxID=873 RepID=F3YVW8_DESAF|nr:murein biosynthesis integral membrane protein MurJ [Desulfocurvibacter africanus]EGJ48926.1 integral membrane protein MviN [Desulfocurvibacter africanus subsp. africanus str. Walvis Bay]